MNADPACVAANKGQNPTQQSFIDQHLDRLAHGSSAQSETFAQCWLRGNLIAIAQLARLNLLAQVFCQFLIFGQ